MASLDDLGGQPDRQEHVVTVLADAFAELTERDPRAFRRKFRKLAATAAAPTSSTATWPSSTTRGPTSARAARGSRATYD